MRIVPSSPKVGTRGCGAIAALLLLASAGLTSAGTPPLPNINTNHVLDVTNSVFAGGAYGNGSSNSAAAISAAISMASTSVIAGLTGGTVRIPAVSGLTNYMSGPITMKSHVNLQIDSGAMLQMFPLSTWQSNYGTTTFIEVGTITDAEISGSGTNAPLGTIDGQGTNWWVTYPSNTGSRPHFIQIDACTRVLIQNVRLQNPPVFTIYMKNGSDTSVTIQGVTINTPGDSHNTDGFDITATNVLIQNCYISTGDDNVEIGGSNPATDITISNCTFGTGHGVSMGSIVSGGVSGLLVSNCTWNGTEYGIKGKSDMDRGGLVRNITYRDLTMSNVNFAVAFYSYYNTAGSPSSSFKYTPQDAATITDSGTLVPNWQNITISNLTAYVIGGNVAGFFWGLPQAPISNVTMSAVKILDHTKTMCMYNVRGIQIIDSNLTAPNSSTNTLTLYNAQFTLTNSAANANLVTITGLGSPSNSVLSLFNGQASMGDASVLGANPLLTLASGTLTVNNNMSVGGSSTLNYGLGTNVTETAVTGNLTLGGTLNIADGGGFNTGTYSLFTYGGTLTYNGLTVGAKPNANFTYKVDTNTIHVVTLDVTTSCSVGAAGPISGLPRLPPVPAGWRIQFPASATRRPTRGPCPLERPSPVVRAPPRLRSTTGVQQFPERNRHALQRQLQWHTQQSGGDGGWCGRSRQHQRVCLGCLRCQRGGVFNFQRQRRDDLHVGRALWSVHRQWSGHHLDYGQLRVFSSFRQRHRHALQRHLQRYARQSAGDGHRCGHSGQYQRVVRCLLEPGGVIYSISSVSGATIYTWAVPSGASIAGGQGTTSITVNWGATSGNVMVTPANANGCTGILSSQAVTVNPTLSCSVSPSSAAICAGGSQIFTVTPSSGTPGYTYLWGDGSTGTSITTNTAGTYSVTVTDSKGCSTTCSATLTVNPTPTIFNVTGGGAYCAGGSGVAVGLDGSQSGGTTNCC